MSKFFSAVLIAGSIAVCSVFAQSTNSIEAQVNKQKIITGELFTYTVIVKGNFSQPKLTLPDFKEFKIVSSSQSKNYAFSAGSTQSDIAITFILFAPKPGVFVIPAAILEDQQNKLSTKPVAIEVSGKSLEEERKIAPYVESGTEI